ncbi:hypothetical protein NHP190003_07610 [Helicobacter sp. NHP19-003]|uniref:Uncharacterized protein n=1 Tax=Helicobacter gastrocanis TaxID=2849641 RepID=A0ABN6I4Q7_9HELI|nr:hypothetical protein [Helicobacter sp. NHP19-003]BCZ17479.1 hypothetical protein NHP190003_07610 [Helicobacter sp. NHP19-003]
MELAKFKLHRDGEKIVSLDQLKKRLNLLDILEHVKAQLYTTGYAQRGCVGAPESAEAMKTAQTLSNLHETHQLAPTTHKVWDKNRVCWGG